ncbi:peptide chain release factor 1 [Fistulina hepatica ATCC 64428]|uniref:Peptide chain release factor 1 n=1 Tax=Fistulina hepatica ATCC 64428 TaxID=1128425 RepID=A0A0D7AN32_9AGAR|nr:peptide chain release factor 1 [Fistulina hepatica ATCC 64428]
MRELAIEDAALLRDNLRNTLAKLPALLIPPSPTRHLNTLLELKLGVGGSESALFMEDLARMYLKLAEARGWRTDVISQIEADPGLREFMVEIKARKGEPGTYDMLRFESGAHRVQRVPATENSGRIHTSTTAVLVLPLEPLYKPEDVRIDIYRSSGAGGQHVNKTESAVRLTHMPTGITVAMQNERSQHQNKRKAYQVLDARLRALKIHRETVERRKAKSDVLGGTDRSEKIRTYNYPQGRVTDHRIQYTTNNLDGVMTGVALLPLLEALQRRYETDQLE